MLLLFKNLLAYIDPGSGSYIVQIIVAGILGTGYFLKTYLYKVTGIFRKLKKKDGDQPTGQV